MVIDRSLSKGLKTQFIKMWDVEVKSAFDAFGKIANKIDLSSRNNFQKFITAHHNCFKRIAVAYVVAGSKRNPFIGMVVVQPNRKNYSDWVEDSVGGLIDIISLTELGHHQDAKRSIFFISEHAIARVYQRSYDAKKGELFDPYIITREFSFIPLWANFWSLVLFYTQDHFIDNESESICPIIPAPNGIFLCKLTEFGSGAKIKLIEIRTYVQNEKLSESQKSLRSLLLEASKNLENSVFCLFPDYEFFGSQQEAIETEGALVKEIMAIKLRDRVRDIASEFVSDNFVAHKLGLAFDEVFRPVISHELFSHYDLILQKKGYAAFSDEVRRMGQLRKRYKV